MNAQFFDMKQIQPPKGLRVIGIVLHPGNDDTGVINGELYDLRPNALIDFRRGRWMEITHWAFVPGTEPEQNEQLKPGDPGFQWPECSQCGSRSLRCGCD